MRTPAILAALAFLALPLAGCAAPEESREIERVRGLVVSVPEEVHRIQVDATASAPQGAFVTVVVEEEDGTRLGSDEMNATGTSQTRVVEVDARELSTVAVVVTSDADAVVLLVVRGLREDGSQIELREEHFVMDDAADQ